MQTVEIACCFDRAFAVPAVVLATSILAHASPGRRYRLHVLYDGDDNVGPALFGVFAGTPLEVRVHRISNPFTDVATSRASLSAAAFVRLTLPDALPDCPRVVYLDVDTLCHADIATLFDTDLGDAPIAASLDPPMANILAIEQRRGEAALPTSFTHYLRHDLGLGDGRGAYFNSGVLVLDLERLRGEGMTGQAREVLARLGPRLRLDDQCVLNALYGRRYHQLGPNWNAMLCAARWREFGWSGVQLMTRVIEGLQNPAVLHYCLNTKPWVRDCNETVWAPLWRAFALAAPLPRRSRLKLFFAGPRTPFRYLHPAVRAKAREIRATLPLRT